MERPIPLLDVLYPYAGTCAFCGFGDKRHRMADAIVETIRAGDTVGMTVDNYGVTEEAVVTLVERWDDDHARDRGEAVSA